MRRSSTSLPGPHTRRYIRVYNSCLYCTHTGRCAMPHSLRFQSMPEKIYWCLSGLKMLTKKGVWPPTIYCEVDDLQMEKFIFTVTLSTFNTLPPKQILQLYFCILSLIKFTLPCFRTKNEALISWWFLTQILRCCCCQSKLGWYLSQGTVCS